MNRKVPDPSLEDTHMVRGYIQVRILVMQIAFFHILNLWIIFIQTQSHNMVMSAHMLEPT